MELTGLLPSKTKIICTIGPASHSQPVLERMMRNGMSIARVNLTHGNSTKQARAIRNIRAAAAAVKQRVTIWGDLPGPKVRIGRLAGDLVQLRQGQDFVLQTSELVGNAERASLSFAGLARVVGPGDRIQLNEGFIQLEVRKADGQEIHCQVLAGGELRSHDGVNLPEIDLGISAFTRRDRARLAFAAEQRLDALSPSFIRDAADLAAVRQAAKEMDYSPYLLAKIERAPAVQNLDAILESADAIVVARGDLGIETPIEGIALLQKQIIRRAIQMGKPAIVATHMLESMTHQLLPTRAEVADVTNAVLDGADCLTLSAETAIGRHPAEVVDMMARIAQVAESQLSTQHGALAQDDGLAKPWLAPQEPELPNTKDSVDVERPVAVLVPAADSNPAHRLSRLRLPTWVVAVCANEATCQALQFCYGVDPVYLPAGPGDWEQVASDWLQRQGTGRGPVLFSQDTALEL